MTLANTSLHEVATFLAQYPPFDALGPEELDRLCNSAEILFFRAGDVAFDQGAPARETFFVVRSGSIALLDGDVVIDVLGSGDVFGHRSLFFGLPTSVAARAEEDALCYRLAGTVARPLLARPQGLRFLARSLTVTGRDHDEAGRALDLSRLDVGGLMTRSPLACTGELPIRSAARQMNERGISSIVVAGRGPIGLVTDADLRRHVVGGDVSIDDRISAIASDPPLIVAPTSGALPTLLTMLERQVRHVVVVEDGEVAGVLTATDMLAAQARLPFRVRDALARAADETQIKLQLGTLPDIAVRLRGVGTSAEQISAVIAVVREAAIKRLLALSPDSPDPSAWLFFGSQARRETALNSDVDTGLLIADGADFATQADLRRAARDVLHAAARSGISSDGHGAAAGARLVSRSAEAWRRLLHGLAVDPWQVNGTAMISLVLDVQAPWDVRSDATFRALVRDLAGHADVRRALGSAATANRPPTGLLRDVVRGPTGQRARSLDLKQDALACVTDIARWAGASAGSPAISTRARLAAAREAGVLTAEATQTLLEAFDLLKELRLDHQIQQVRDGEAADDVLDPTVLSRLTRSYLRDAFRAIAGVQRETHIGPLP